MAEIDAIQLRMERLTEELFQVNAEIELREKVGLG